jgi:hypothetical protein
VNEEVCCIAENAVVDICVLDEGMRIVPFTIKDEGYTKEDREEKDVSKIQGAHDLGLKI